LPDLLPFAQRTFGNDAVNTVNARDLYVFLELAGDYNLWIRRAIKRANLLEHKDFEVIYRVVGNSKGGRPAAEHHLSFDAAKHVAMMSSVDKGHEVREWFIAKEKELNTRFIGTPTTTAQMFAMQSQVNLEHERQIFAIEAFQQAQQAQLDTQGQALAVLTARRPPVNRLDPLSWLRKYHKPFLAPSLLKIFRARCRALEEPISFRPEEKDYPIPYYTEDILGQAYDESTRQIRFFEGTYDPGVPYERRKRGN
jgi:phage anti-repressor protein